MTDPFSIHEAVWHKCAVAPLLAIGNGERNQPGRMGRRKVGGKWEYRQGNETQEQVERCVY